MSKLTEVDTSYILFIVEYYRKTWFYPSYDEIAEGMSHAKATVFLHMQKLEKEGILIRKAPASPMYRIANMDLLLNESEVSE